MACTCPDSSYTLTTNDLDEEICVKKIKPNRTPVYFDNTAYFEDVSWTIAYKPTEGSWSSYFSFTPDYSPFHNNFFQVGYNWGQDKGTLWNHTMSNKSFQVFQGRLYPFKVEYPVQNENVNKMLNSIELNIEGKRYQNNWDYSQWKGVGFNKLTVYNNTNNSGVLNLFEQKSLADIKNYPKTNLNNTQDILYSSTEGKHNLNYFFNRVVNQDNNIPIWLWDKNMINKTINSKAVNFNQKRLLERLKGETFTVSLTNDKESRFNILLKNSIQTEIAYE
jgi:hypothetical protein